MMHAYYWDQLTTRDFADLDPESTVALLPVAAVEQHGPHLPLATDAIINEGLVRGLMAARTGGARLLALPPLCYGHSPEHTAFAGTLSLGPQALLSVWLDIGRSVARAGVRKLILLNTHGGQSSLIHVAAMQLRAECAILAVRANYFAFGAPAGIIDAQELSHGLHGGEFETSLMLHLRPDLVRMSAAQNFIGLAQQMAGEGRLLGVEKPIGFGWMSQDLNPHGVCGNAARADAIRGRRLLDHLVDALGRLVDEVGAMSLNRLRAGQPD